MVILQESHERRHGGKIISQIEFREGDLYSANFDVDYYYTLPT